MPKNQNKKEVQGRKKEHIMDKMKEIKGIMPNRLKINMDRVRKDILWAIFHNQWKSKDKMEILW